MHFLENRIQLERCWYQVQNSFRIIGSPYLVEAAD